MLNNGPSHSRKSLDQKLGVVSHALHMVDMADGKPFVSGHLGPPVDMEYDIRGIE